jgi:queuine tRNA-ribosyltransferase
MTYPFIESLELKNGNLHFPVFMPDATFGLVRSVDSADLENANIQAVVMNAFHLMQKPGTSTIQSFGGLHEMSGWYRPIITDSGGFQAYSLIRQNSKFGNMTSKGINFQPEGSNRKFQLTPEKSIQLQLAYGSDVVICLDDCTHVDSSPEEQELSVNRTISWAKKCRATFDKLVTQKKLVKDEQPLLFGVIQGGGIKDLRKHCADELLKIGFDGYGYGGWPLDNEGNLLTDILQFTRQLIPDQFPMHALGIGHPYNVLACYQLGYGIFDCAMPTRDARHGRLYQFAFPLNDPNLGLHDNWLKYLYINDEEHIKNTGPISEGCDCLTCHRYSRGYLHHLFKMNDSLFMRLATIHNLRFMTQLTERIQKLTHG